MADQRQSSYVFFISQVGAVGSEERDRADEVERGIIRIAADAFGLEVRRADLEDTPGQVTTQIVQLLLGARVVIADLTGRNANVYYELGIAHAFARPVVLLVDHARSLTFDMQNERAIEIGDSGRIKVAEASTAADKLTKTLQRVLEAGYEPSNVVTAAATARSLEGMAPGDPIAAELVALRDSLTPLLTEMSGLRSAVEISSTALGITSRDVRSMPTEILRTFDEGLLYVDPDQKREETFESLRGSQRVDLMFTTARVMIRRHGHTLREAVLRNSCQLRILLADVTASIWTDEFVAALCPRVDIPTEVDQSIKEIRGLVAEIKEEAEVSATDSRGSVEVRLFRCAPTGNLIIVDGVDARFAPYLPYIDSRESPAFGFTATERGRLLPRLQRAFDVVWGNATSVLRADLAHRGP